MPLRRISLILFLPQGLYLLSLTSKLPMAVITYSRSVSTLRVSYSFFTAGCTSQVPRSLYNLEPNANALRVSPLSPQSVVPRPPGRSQSHPKAPAPGPFPQARRLPRPEIRLNSSLVTRASSLVRELSFPRRRESRNSSALACPCGSSKD